LQADVSRADQVRDAVARLIDRYDRLNVLVNNAIRSRRDPVAEVTDETLDRMITVGLKAHLLGGRRRGDHQHGVACG